jgi:hypothetical protein
MRYATARRIVLDIADTERDEKQLTVNLLLVTFCEQGIFPLS